MTDATSQSSSGALLEGPGTASGPAQSVIAEVAKTFGVHPLRQMKEMLSMRVGAQKLGSNEYYDLRVFDPAHDKRAKREFLGQGGINALNIAMNPDSLMETKNFVGNKLAYTHHLNEAGIASTRTQAFVNTQVDPKGDFVIPDAEALETFMRERAEYPLFGKPFGGSLSEGSVAIEALEGDELILGNGNRIPLADFAADVLRVYGEGYLLQSRLMQHRDMTRIAGPAVGCVRIVTANDGSGAAPVYGVWKMPGPKAMSDNFWQDGSMLALLDLEDGRITRCHRGKGPSAELLEVHPVSGEPVTGFTIPHWDAILKAATAAHAQFPDLGVCGFDVAVTDEGPVVIECNDNPNHLLYQYPARQGIRNATLMPAWDAVVARQKALARAA